MSWLLQGVAEHCPIIEELALGWNSEFYKRQLPTDEVQFATPCTAVPAAVVSAVFGVVAALHRDVAAAPAWRASLATSKERFRQLTHALETSEPGLVSGD